MLLSPGKKSSHTFAVMAAGKSPYLEECLLSLSRQTVKSPAILFSSTPSAWLTALADRHGLPLIINRERQGIVGDLNFAYENADSPFVTLVHQDDIYLPRYTESCLAALERSAEERCLLVFTWYREFSKKREGTARVVGLVKKILLWPTLWRPSIRSSLLKKAVLMFGSPIPTPTVMFNKQLIGEFRFNPAFLCSMDWEAYLRLAEREGSFIFVNKDLLLHRVHEESVTSRQLKAGRRQEEDRQIFRRMWPAPLARLLLAAYTLSYRVHLF